MKPSLRPVWAEVDLAAVRGNVQALLRAVTPVPVLAVVKADAYGHGAVEVANAATNAGASMLGVALVEEGIALREQGVAAEILLLSEPTADAAGAVVEYRLTPAVYTLGGVGAIEAAAKHQKCENFPVHLKIDTGMHRVGADLVTALEVARAVEQSTALQLAAVWTHLAVADERDNEYTDSQLERFENAVRSLRAQGTHPPMLHVANTAAARPKTRLRCDIEHLSSESVRVAMRPRRELRRATCAPLSEVDQTRRMRGGEVAMVTGVVGAMGGTMETGTAETVASIGRASATCAPPCDTPGVTEQQSRSAARMPSSLGQQP